MRHTTRTAAILAAVMAMTVCLAVPAGAGITDRVRDFLAVKSGQSPARAKAEAFNVGTPTKPAYAILNKVVDEGDTVPPGLSDAAPLSLDEMGPVIHWRAEPWSACSVFCGSAGTKTHGWTCSDRAGNGYDTCLDADRPDDVTVACENACPTSCRGAFAMLPDGESGTYTLSTPAGPKDFYCDKDMPDWKRLDGSASNYAYVAAQKPTSIRSCSSDTDWSDYDVHRFTEIGHGWTGIYDYYYSQLGNTRVSSFDYSSYFDMAPHLSHLADADFPITFYPRVNRYSYKDQMWWYVYRYNPTTGASTQLWSGYLYNSGHWAGFWYGSKAYELGNQNYKNGDTRLRFRVRGKRLDGSVCDAAARFYVTFFNDIPRTCIYWK